MHMDTTTQTQEVRQTQPLQDRRSQSEPVLHDTLYICF